MRKIEPKRLYIECLGRLPLGEFLLVIYKEYVIPLACLLIWSIGSMFGEQVGHYLICLFFSTFGAFCMVILDTSTEVVLRTIVLNVLSFTFYRCDRQLFLFFSKILLI